MRKGRERLDGVDLMVIDDDDDEEHNDDDEQIGEHVSR